MLYDFLTFLVYVVWAMSYVLSDILTPIWVFLNSF